MNNFLIDQLQKHQNLIRNMAMKICGKQVSRDDIDDLVSMVNLVLLDRKLAKYSPDRGMELSTFIGMIAKRAVIDYMRSKRDWVGYAEDMRDLEVADPTLTIEMAAIDMESHSKLMMAVALLPKRENDLILALLEEDFTPQKYAESKNVSVGSVAIMKMRAINRLRDILTSSQFGDI
jgi:RNA polymerase sigma factor (sigma-70 family)